MKTIILYLLLLLTASAEELVWSDEFNGVSLNSTRWNVNTDKRHSAINSKEAVVVKNGMLQIKTFTRGEQHYSGLIDTAGKFEISGGRLLIRAKFNDQPGTWSCGWLYTHTAGEDNQDVNKHGMEVDVFEHRLFDMYRKDISDVVNHTLHWYGYGKYHKCAATDTTIKKNEFNIFELRWTKDRYEFFVNGKQTWTASPVTTKPLFLILSTEVGFIDFWTQPLLKEYNHTTLLVDYIRYYK